MLHLANGESTVAALREAGVGGAIESADDIFMEGPTRALQETRADREARASFLERYLEIPAAVYLAGSERRTALLGRALEEDEAVLWFEEDLFCQANTMQALSWLHERGADGARLTCVCPPPEERVGPASAARLRELFAVRRPVTHDLLVTASTAWQAFSSEQPLALNEQVEQGDFAAWPELRNALRAQMARYPFAGSGVNRLEAALLENLRAGPASFGTVFGRLSQRLPEYGVGDSSVARYVLDLSRDPALIALETGNGAPALSHPGFRNWTLTLTDLGRAVLAGQEDYGEHARFDRWLGGVHLQGRPAWRFAEATQRLISAGPAR